MGRFEDVERLAEMLDQGKITREEYDELKKQLMADAPADSIPTAMSEKPPGWYGDPAGKLTHEAWWDGNTWTGATRVPPMSPDAQRDFVAPPRPPTSLWVLWSLWLWLLFVGFFSLMSVMITAGCQDPTCEDRFMMVWVPLMIVQAVLIVAGGVVALMDRIRILTWLAIASPLTWVAAAPIWQWIMESA